MGYESASGDNRLNKVRVMTKKPVKKTLSQGTVAKPASSQESSSPRKRVAIALQGGGAHGAFTWGVLDAFLEDGRVDVEGISGTSAGGMNAVAFIQGYMKGGREGARKELRRFWEVISDYALVSSPFRPSLQNQLMGNPNLGDSPGYIWMNFLQGMLSPYQLNPMNVNVLESFAKSFFDFEALRNVKDMRLFLCATHVATGKLKIFRLEDLKLEVLLASACLPFLFHAVEIEGEHYWDGGFVGNPAIYPLIYECETPDVMVIQLTAMHRPDLPQTSREIIDRHKEITYNACLMREMRSINFISKLIDDGLLDPNKIKRLNVHLIRNEETFEKLEISSALNADLRFLEHLFQEGRKTGKAWLEKHYDDIGVRTTAEIQKDFVD